jgi:hypothetical protein
MLPVSREERPSDFCRPTTRVPFSSCKRQSQCDAQTRLRNSNEFPLDLPDEGDCLVLSASRVMIELVTY